MKHTCSSSCDPNDEDHQLRFALEESLYTSIDTLHVTCLNEHQKNAGRSILKPWNERLDTKNFVKTGVDTDLLLHVPFTVAVAPKSFVISGDDDGSSPNLVHVFKNKDNLDFSTAERMKPDQTFNLNVDKEAKIDYLFKQSKFNNTTSLTFYFPTNFGSKNTKIFYLGLKGTSTSYKREIVKTVYESKPMPKDHKVKDDFGMSKTIE